MATAEKKEVQEDLNFNSDRLSTQVRLVAVGLLAIVWALVINPPTGIAIDRRSLLWVVAVVILSMLVDLIQYAAGYALSLQVFNELEKGKEVGYPRRGVLYRVRIGAFWGKQLAVVAAGGLFLAVVVPELLKK